MAATVYVQFDNGGSDGAPGNNTVVEGLGAPNIRFKSADNATIDTNDPVVIPASGSTYSYFKQICLFCSGAPSSQIDNVRFYTDGANGLGTGVMLLVGSECIGQTGSYEVCDANTDMVTQHTGIASMDDAFGFTSGGTVKNVSCSGNGDNLIQAVDEKSDYIVLQARVADDASPGATSDETLTFMYDEI
jgi:hypothetical protein